jgi:hypothetical protein
MWHIEYLKENKYVYVIYCEEFNTVLVIDFSVDILIVYLCVIYMQFLVSV